MASIVKNLRLLADETRLRLLLLLQGEELTVTAKGNMVMLTDAKGGMSHVTIADVMQSNGVIHVVDRVLMAR